MNDLCKTVIAKHNGKFVIIFLKNDRMERIHSYSEINGFSIGTIVNARITGNLKNIDASFLQFGEGKFGFVNKTLKCETVIPVVYKKEPSNEKKALFSDKLIIEGEYSIVRQGNGHFSVSSKIPGEVSEKIKNTFSEITESNDYDITIRTRTYKETEGIAKAVSEVMESVNIISGIVKNYIHVPQYTVLYKPKSDFLKEIKAEIEAGSSEIVTDEKDVYDFIISNIEFLTGEDEKTDRVNLRFYKDNLLPLCKLYGFDAKISEVLSRKIYLKSGAYITFDNTEALCAIDVNSAKIKSAENCKEESFLEINLEAAKEIARQIRLRNMSGNIIIDFISMEKASSYEILEDYIKEMLKDDIVKSEFFGFTGLKLAEICRQKKQNSFYVSYKG